MHIRILSHILTHKYPKYIRTHKMSHSPTFTYFLSYIHFFFSHIYQKHYTLFISNTNPHITLIITDGTSPSQLMKLGQEARYKENETLKKSIFWITSHWNLMTSSRSEGQEVHLLNPTSIRRTKLYILVLYKRYCSLFIDKLNHYYRYTVNFTIWHKYWR